MEVFIEPIGRLMNEFSKLPGVGKKTAQKHHVNFFNIHMTNSAIFAANFL